MEAVHVEIPVITATERPLRLLLLEKSLGDCQDILEELRAAGISIEPTVVATREEFLDAISSQDFSMILSEFDLPRWNGVDALHELRKSGRPTPFILVTGILGKDAAAECLRLGASDYILKDHLVRLPMALKRMLEEKRLRDANEAAQQALQENETRNRELIENSVYGVFRASLDGSFLFANPALLQILACSSLSVLQSLSLATDVFRFPEQYVKLLASCRAGGFVPSTEAEWRRKDGGLVAVKLHLRYLSYPGAPDHIEGIVEDITEIRALEHQLLQVQKFETIGQLAGGIAHDFNNVVGAILGWAELGYEESQAFPSIAERFARIRSQADRAAALTRELLSYAHCQELRPRPVDLNSVIQGLSTFLDKVLGSDIEMKLTLGELQSVHADPIQISQVLMNLCLNARDAMPNGGRLLIGTEMIHLDDYFCRFYPHVTPGRHAVFSVSDTGTGMTQEIRERIFEPLFTTKERGTASGMGLASAYGIVKQHGGFIHVYSEPGQGSLFRVYLPAIQEAHPATSLKPEANEVSQSASLAGTEAILLAEDHDSIREMTREWLANLGYQVLSAADGEEALLLCDQRTPAVAVLDLVMPRLGGAATAIQLRTRFPNLPILFTSGYAKSSGTPVSQLPNSAYLQKPYSPTSLGWELRKILDPVSSWQS